MKNYNKFALYYDKMGADRHSARMVDYCLKLFRKFKMKPRTGLDLCCGTGTAISLLSDQNVKMSGLDRSPQMLAIAARKLNGRGIKLYQKELPKFRLMDLHDSTKILSFDLVTCFYDSLNYLTIQKDLILAFRNIRKYLNPDGYFIFDMNTENALTSIWSANVYSGIREDFAWIWASEFDKRNRTTTCRTSFFARKGNHWERFDEYHTEKTYSNTVIQRCLHDAGFTIKGFYRCFTFEKPTKQTNRICVVARRR